MSQTSDQIQSNPQPDGRRIVHSDLLDLFDLAGFCVQPGPQARVLAVSSLLLRAPPGGPTGGPPDRLLAGLLDVFDLFVLSDMPVFQLLFLPV